LIASGGICVAFLGLLSVLAVAIIIYSFRTLVPQKLTPPEFTDNILFLVEKKEYDKAIAVCRSQENMISAIALKGLLKLSKGKAVAEEAMQTEGKARIDKLWQNLSYLSDLAVVAPMVGLLGTVFGMIDAFNFFKAGTVHPGVLTQGLAKAMVNTALGLMVAVPCLIFYSYFRGKASAITSAAETAASEIGQSLTK
jgi:biopolymer transport protein ExbB